MDADSNLIRRMRRGDEDAFDAFVRKYYGQMLAYCAYHCHDREEAKDLAQETFLRFVSSLPEYSHRGKAKSYLYTIAGNLCKNHYRKHGEHRCDPFDENAFGTGSDGDVVSALVVRDCLDRLQDEYREVIILFYYQDLRQSEIADILGIGVPLVKYRLRQGKEQMRRLLEEE